MKGEIQCTFYAPIKLVFELCISICCIDGFIYTNYVHTTWIRPHSNYVSSSLSTNAKNLYRCVQSLTIHRTHRITQYTTYSTGRAQTADVARVESSRLEVCRLAKAGTYTCFREGSKFAEQTWLEYIHCVISFFIIAIPIFAYLYYCVVHLHTEWRILTTRSAYTHPFILHTKHNSLHSMHLPWGPSPSQGFRTSGGQRSRPAIQKGHKIESDVRARNNNNNQASVFIWLTRCAMKASQTTQMEHAMLLNTDTRTWAKMPGIMDWPMMRWPL